LNADHVWHAKGSLTPDEKKMFLRQVDVFAAYVPTAIMRSGG
jgi:hypothetical protein